MESICDAVTIYVMLHNRYLFTIIVEHLCNNHIKANTTLVKHKQREFDIIQNKVSCPPLDRATQKIIRHLQQPNIAMPLHSFIAKALLH